MAELNEGDARKTRLRHQRRNGHWSADRPAESLLPSRVEIDLAALANNLRRLKAHVGGAAAIMAVVKANAYGHGALTIAKTALEQGASQLAVANLAEALELRLAGITAPILVLGVAPVHALPVALRHDITLSIFDRPLARQYHDTALALGSQLKTHIKVDSGMGRLGVMPGDMAGLLRQLRSLDGLRADGIYTHFSAADEDPIHTRRQLETFRSVLDLARAHGVGFKHVHASNSAALISGGDCGFNLARPGLLLYGLSPSPASAPMPGLRPVMAWKTVVAQVKRLPPNSPVGYGNAYVTRGTESIAVLPVGYADGLRRSPNPWREALIRGCRAPLVGRISMEKTTVNVSHIPGARAGDEVVLLGEQGDDHISADEIAGWLGTINYEALTSIAPRQPRFYADAAQASSHALRSAAITLGKTPN